MTYFTVDVLMGVQHDIELTKPQGTSRDLIVSPIFNSLSILGSGLAMPWCKNLLYTISFRITSETLTSNVPFLKFSPPHISSAARYHLNMMGSCKYIS